MNRSVTQRRGRHDAPSRLWHKALEYALQPSEPIANPPQQWPAIRVLSVNNSGNRAEVELRFRAGELYCCGEPGCFLPTYEMAWWRQVRAHLREVSDREPPPMSLRIFGVVEAGAMFAVNEQLDLPFASKAYTYRHAAEHEGHAWDMPRSGRRG